MGHLGRAFFFSTLKEAHRAGKLTETLTLQLSGETEESSIMDRGNLKDLEKMESLKIMSLLLFLETSRRRQFISSTKENVFKLSLSDIIS